MTGNDDNIESAMARVAETINKSVSPIVKTDDGPADKQVLIRTTEYERERWKQASESEQITLSAWIRNILNAEATRILECDHPMNMVRFYPWSKVCTKCGKRLK
jgi:uncharacterized protein YgbK (DUF1537 family)